MIRLVRYVVINITLTIPVLSGDVPHMRLVGRFLASFQVFDLQSGFHPSDDAGFYYKP